MIGELTTQLSSHPTSKRAGLYCKAVKFCHINFPTTLSQIKKMCISGNPTVPNFLGEIYHFFIMLSQIKNVGGTGIKYLY